MKQYMRERAQNLKQDGISWIGIVAETQPRWPH
jgi:hypothetical protein